MALPLEVNDTRSEWAGHGYSRRRQARYRPSVLNSAPVRPADAAGYQAAWCAVLDSSHWEKRWALVLIRPARRVST